MTSVAQFFDINKNPFIVTGRKIIDSLKLQVRTHYVSRFDGKPGAFAGDCYFLYFDPHDFSDIYSDFLIKAFADKKEFYPPVKAVYGSRNYILTFYKCNFRSVDEKLETVIWGKEETIKETEHLKKYLHDYLTRYFYKYLSF